MPVGNLHNAAYFQNEELFSAEFLSGSTLKQLSSLMEFYGEDGDVIASGLYSELRSILTQRSLNVGYSSFTEYAYSRMGLCRSVTEALRQYAAGTVRSEDIEPAEDTDISPSELLGIFENIPVLGDVLGRLSREGRIKFSDSSYTLLAERDSLPEVYVCLRGKMSDTEVLSHELGHAAGMMICRDEVDILSSEIHGRMAEYFTVGFLPTELREEYCRYLFKKRRRHILLTSALSEFEEVFYDEMIPMKEAGEVWKNISRKYSLGEMSLTAAIKSGRLSEFPLYSINYFLSGIYSYHKREVLTEGNFGSFLNKNYNIREISDELLRI